MNLAALVGSKTYIVAALLGGLAVAQYMKWVTPELAMTIGTALAGGGFAALRAAATTEAREVKKDVAVVAGIPPEAVPALVAAADRKTVLAPVVGPSVEDRLEALLAELRASKP